VNHQEARDHVVEGFRRTFGHAPKIAEAQILQGIGWLETQYGQGWRGNGKGSHNWGAIQSGRTPCDPAKSFEYTDTTPTSSGTSVPYRICFRKYADDDAGAADLARVAYQRRPTVLVAATKGDIMAVSTAMYDTTYYQGFGPTREARIANHHRALLAAIQKGAQALGEAMPDGSVLPPRTLRLQTPRMSGTDVERAQRLLCGNADAAEVLVVLAGEQFGTFGSVTVKMARAFQAAHAGLACDGIVGPRTWAALEASAAGPPAKCDHQ